MAPSSFPWHELPAPALERAWLSCAATVLALGCTNKTGQRQAATMPLHGVHAAHSDQQRPSNWLAANCHRVIWPWPFPLAPFSKPWSLDDGDDGNTDPWFSEDEDAGVCNELCSTTVLREVSWLCGCGLAEWSVRFASAVNALKNM